MKASRVVALVAAGALALAACGSSPASEISDSSGTRAASAVVSPTPSLGTPVNAEFDYAVDPSRKVHVKIASSYNFTTDVTKALAGNTDVFVTESGMTTITNLSKDRAISKDDLLGFNFGVYILVSKNSTYCKISECKGKDAILDVGGANELTGGEIPPSGTVRVPFVHNGEISLFSGPGFGIPEAEGEAYIRELNKPVGMIIPDEVAVFDPNSGIVGDDPGRSIYFRSRLGINTCGRLTAYSGDFSAVIVLWKSDPSLDVCRAMGRDPA